MFIGGREIPIVHRVTNRRRQARPRFKFIKVAVDDTSLCLILALVVGGCSQDEGHRHHQQDGARMRTRMVTACS
ncbi:hypothetical protein EJB05_08813, partial [Eragrostis curvula]